MKKLRVTLLVGVLAMLLSLVGVALARSGNTVEPEYVPEEELMNRLTEAEVLAVNDCVLPSPTKEGLPVNMGPFSPEPRSAFGNTGSMVSPTQPGQVPHPIQCRYFVPIGGWWMQKPVR